MTLSEWETELRELRSDLSHTQPMRLRWRTKSHLEPGASPASIVLGDGIGETLVFALYRPAASRGDRPAVEVEVSLSAAIYDVPQGEVVEVAGTPEPGHAVVVLIGDQAYWPVYPATLGLRAPRL